MEVEGREEEIQVMPDDLSSALHLDTVKIVMTGKGMARVAEVISRSRTRFVGSFVDGEFVPDDRRMYLPVRASALDLDVTGKKVLVEVTDWSNVPVEGKVVSILGRAGEHETEIRSILASGGIVYDFPNNVEEEAKKIQSTAKQTMQEEGARRRDMRKTTTFTIDPADAKDFDDALSLKDLGNGKWEVGVHIADVSYFVRPGTALDDEARARANSVYMVDRTVPMLPEALSADICSLVPNQDRLTYSAIFEMDEKGKVHKEWFGRTIIHSVRRFTYEEAAKVLESGSGDYAKELKVLDAISKNLLKDRLSKGSIIFEKDEIRVELGPDKKPSRIYIKERLATHKLIEEFMLLANKHVAHYLARGAEKRGSKALYRIHDLPARDRIDNVLNFLKALGYKLDYKGKTFGARQIHDLFDQVKGEDIESLVQTAVLRSMSKAIYSTKNIGHFGLGFEHYTHFTSPIRRYPDLMVHRMITKELRNEKISEQEVASFERMAKYASEKEQEAAHAERESIKYKQAEYMEGKIGEEFDGQITGVTEWGIYVEELKTKCEGMVRLGSIGDDFYEFDEKKYALIGKRSKKAYRLGDKVRIKLSEVDVPHHQLTWELRS